MKTLSPEARELIGDHKLAAVLDTYLTNSPTKRARTPDLVKSSDLPEKWRELLSKQTSDVTRFFDHLLDIKNRYTFLSRLIEAKLMKSLEASLLGLHTRNDLALALCVRSIYEQIGSLASIHHESSRFLKEIRRLTSFTEANTRADALVQAYRVQMLGTRFFTSSEDLAKMGLVRASNVMDLIDSADKEIPQFRRYYDLLCEIVHPNYLSNAVLTNANLTDWSPEPDESFQADIRTWIFDALSGALTATEDFTDDWFWHFIYEIDHLYRKVLVHRKPFNALFNEAAFGFCGDGKSEVNAIQFKCRSWREHFRMFDVYRKENISAEQPLQLIKETQDADFHYDHYTAGSQPVIVRIPKSFDFPASASNRWIYGRTVYRFALSDNDAQPTDFNIVLAELPPRISTEFIFILQGEEPCISSIAETKPFGFYIINPGIWRAPDGTPVLFIQFKISATGIDGAAIKKITYVANPLSKAELDCLRAIGRQSHVHLFILNEAQEQLNFFEFQNNFSLTEFADFAERASEGMASHDFTKARSEFLAAHP
jgi:hypothetical protein